MTTQSNRAPTLKPPEEQSVRRLFNDYQFPGMHLEGEIIDFTLVNRITIVRASSRSREFFAVT